MRGSFLNCFSTLILGYMSWTNKLHRFLLFGKPALNESKEHFRTCSVPALYQSKRRKSTPSIPFSCFGVTWGTVSAEKESRKNGWLLVKGQSWWGVLERAEDERVPDSPFQQQHHLLIPIAMVAELQTRNLEIQFSGGLNICFWHSQKCTSISMLIDPLEPRDHLFLHLYCLGRTARKT